MPIRMVIIKMSGNRRCWRGCGETGTLLQCWWECKLVKPLWKTMWWFLKDLEPLEPEIPLDPAIPLLGIYPKIITHSIIKTHAHICLFQHCSQAKIWNQPKCPSMIHWIKKMWHIYTMEYYAAIKKDEFRSFARTWIKLKSIILSKLTWEQKTKHRMFLLISGCWTMRTQGHRERNITHQGLLQGDGGIGEG